MDLRKCRNQEESGEEHYAAKIPKLSYIQHPLPLFPDPISRSPSTTTTFGILGEVGLFSKTQWQELELQALILRHLLAGAAIPPHLLHSYYLLQPTLLLQSGYWGRMASDPEPGRCRRTDGKKWRCSRDVAANHKYCDRHLNRGKSRSRKPVEIITTANTQRTAGMPFSSSVIPLHQNPRSSSLSESDESFFGVEDDMTTNGRRSDGQLLRRFIDDSETNLTIGTTRSDTSLKLATGNNTSTETDAQLHALSVGSWGGPLAEALRTSVPNSPSPHITSFVE